MQAPSAGHFLVRGLGAGLVAGIAAFVVAYLVGEPAVNAALALEQESPGAHHPPEGVVPRSLQSTLGLLTGTAVAGGTLGGLLGMLTALALGRLGQISARATTLALTGIGFVALVVVPTLAYPPNPPAVGQHDTIGERTALFFVLTAISVIAAVTAVLVGRRLAGRWGGWYATLAAAAGYLVVALTAVALLPAINEVPADYPAQLLVDFRRASLLTSLALWSVLGVVLAELVHRLTTPKLQPVPAGRVTP